MKSKLQGVLFSFVAVKLHRVDAVSSKAVDTLDHFALRPQKPGCLLGTGTGVGGGEEGERVKVRPQIPPEKDRRDRGPPPEQWKC